MGLRKTVADVKRVQQPGHIAHELSSLIFAICIVGGTLVTEDQNRQPFVVGADRIDHRRARTWMRNADDL